MFCTAHFMFPGYLQLQLYHCIVPNNLIPNRLFSVVHWQVYEWLHQPIVFMTRN